MPFLGGLAKSECWPRFRCPNVSMQQSWVFAAVASRLHAEQVVERLKADGVASDDVSVLVPGPPREEGAAKPSIDVIRAVARCGALSWLAPLHVVSTPDGSQLVAGGPLGDLVDEPGSGGLEGVLEGLKVGRTPAQKLIEQLGSGRPLVSVRTASPTRFILTCELFHSMGATDLAVGSSGERPSSDGRAAGFSLPRFA